MSVLVNIILASANMCKDLAELKKQVWETTYRGIYPDNKFDNFSIESECEKFLNIINNLNTNLYVAKVENKLIGYMAIGKSPRRQNSDTDEIVLLYILKDYQGIGVGKKFFNIAKEKLKKERR